MRKLYFVVLMSLILGKSFGQFSLTATTYSQDFNGLGTTTSTGVTGGDLNIVSATLNGWFFLETLANANTTITAGTGSSTAGDTYNFGLVANADRTLGSLRSGSLNSVYGFYFTNNTSIAITNIDLTYTGKTWRVGAASRIDRLDFQYSTDATSLSTGTWIDVNTLDYANPGQATGSGSIQHSAVITNSIAGISVPIGSTLFIRWVDSDATGSDDGMGIDDLSFTASAPTTTNYYSKPAGNLTDVATWGTNIDGTGSQPIDFISNYQAFNVVNRVSTTLDANWTVSGSGSKVIVGEGTTGTELILPNTAALTGTVDVTNLSTLRLENSTLPTFGTLATGSTVNYAQTATPYIVPTGGTYSNLTITNGVKTLNTGTITVNGNLVLDGVTDFNGSGSPFTTIALSGDFSMINGATFAPSPAGDAPRLTLNCVSTVATQTLSGGDFYLFRLVTTVASSPTLNVALAANANLQLGNTSSSAGGLNIINASQTLSLLGNNVVTLYGLSRIQATNFGTISGNSTSALNIAPTGTVATVGTIGFTPGFQQLGTLSINSSFAGDNTLILTTPLTITTALNLTAGYINIGNNNLTVAGNITGGSGAGFVQTTGTGTLTRNGVGAGPVMFPIGSLTYNPIAISNGSGNNFSARVALGILDPSGAIPVDAVERTWYIGANVNTAGVTVAFEYNTSDCSPGASAQPLTMEILQSDYSTWHLSAGNGAIPAIGPAPWTVTSAAPLTINNGLIPYTLGVSGTAILAVDYFITAKAQKQNNNALISWTVGNAAGVNSFEVQRSVGNGAYQTIGMVAASSGQVNYQFTDFAADKGTNLYRIRVNRLAGGVRYSNTVAVINGSNGLLITGLWPNPAQDKAQLTLSTAKAGSIRFELYGLNGVMVKSWTAAAAEGTNVMTLSTGDLRAGVYHLVATGQEAKSVFRFIKQ